MNGVKDITSAKRKRRPGKTGHRLKDQDGISVTINREVPTPTVAEHWRSVRSSMLLVPESVVV